MFMKQKDILINYYEVDSIDDLENEEIELIKTAREITKNAYAPYSGFHVGAAVLLENGKILAGSNQENAAYPSGLCAERVALFYANSKYPDVPVKSMALCAVKHGNYFAEPVSPCGSCRQVILETESRFEKPVKVIMIGEKIIRIIDSAKALLPLSFDKKSLEQ